MSAILKKTKPTFAVSGFNIEDSSRSSIAKYLPSKEKNHEQKH